MYTAQRVTAYLTRYTDFYIFCTPILCTFVVHRAEGRKTTSKYCFSTTGEVHLMRGRDSDNEFSGRVTEASHKAKQETRLLYIYVKKNIDKKILTSIIKI